MVVFRLTREDRSAVSLLPRSQQTAARPSPPPSSHGSRTAAPDSTVRTGDSRRPLYGAFGEVPTRPELERFFFLDDDDRDLIVLRRSDVHRLGTAAQIGTVRYIATLSRVPVNRLNTPARYGQLSKAQTIERAPGRFMLAQGVAGPGGGS
ncbi:DUF4158 domain-containing protein [Streptomyces sp. NPDC056227]|uniref:DUF4158 domain-containing protein n=1 Tax=Streptomyces sp. NPDC056227 TaxID=3345753 RepID=UPI0035DA6B01